VKRFRHIKTILLLIGFLLTSIHFAEAQQPIHKIPRVGFLGSVSSHVSGDRSRVEGLRLGLRQLGYVEGKNILIEYRYAGGKVERLPSLAAELVSLQVDILLARGAPAAHAAKNATSTIPIIFGNAADPVGTGLVSSLARPGGNITGLSDLNSGVITKRLELIKEVVPKVFHIAVFLNPANPTNLPQSKEIDAVAPAFGCETALVRGQRS
jgi:putative ABC transport system substrate-binding protein